MYESKNHYTGTISAFFVSIAVLAALDVVSTTNGAVIDRPVLPPQSSAADNLARECQQVVEGYKGTDEPHATYGPDIDLTDILHQCFTDVVVTTDGADEIEDFNSVVRGRVTIRSLGLTNEPISVSGPVRTRVIGKAGAVEGTWETEIVSMNLSGVVLGTPITLRESPTMDSRGETTVKALPNDMWSVDSVFDVFTELSIDNGPFVVQDEPMGTHVVFIPEPSAALLLVFGLVGLVLAKSRPVGT